MSNTNQELAQNPATSPKILSKLAKEHPELIPFLAANPSTPAIWLDKWGKNESFSKDIKKNIAKNPNTYKQTLDYLSDNYDMADYVAGNPNTSAKTLDILSQSNRALVKNAIAKNTSKFIWYKTLERLVDDSINCCRDCNSLLHISLSKNPNLNMFPTNIIGKLSLSKYWETRLNLVNNLDITKYNPIITQLTNDPDHRVKSAAQEKLKQYSGNQPKTHCYLCLE